MSQIEVCNVDMPDATLYQFALSRLPPPSQPASFRPSLANLKTRVSQGEPLSLLGKDANAARLTASIADLEQFKRGLFGEAPIVGGGKAVTIKQEEAKSPSAKEGGGGGDGDHREIFPNAPPDAPPLFEWTNQMAANARLMRHLQTPKASFAASPLDQAAMDELDERQLEEGLPTNAFNMAMEGEGEELMDEEEDEAGHKRRPIRAKLHPSSQDQDRTNGDAGKKRPFPYGTAAGAKGAGEGEVKSPLLPPSVSTMASRQQPRRAAATAAGSSAGGGVAPPSPTPSSNANTGISQQQQQEQQSYYDNTHCYCGKVMAGSAMIACDQCHVWFHSQCVGMTNEEVNNWPEEEPYLCHRCHPASKCLKPNNGNAKAAPKKRAVRK